MKVQNALNTLCINHRCWMHDEMLNTNRDIYEYFKCWVTGSCPLFKYGKITKKFTRLLKGRGDLAWVWNCSLVSDYQKIGTKSFSLLTKCCIVGDLFWKTLLSSWDTKVAKPRAAVQSLSQDLGSRLHKSLFPLFYLKTSTNFNFS